MSQSGCFAVAFTLALLIHCIHCEQCVFVFVSLAKDREKAKRTKRKRGPFFNILFNNPRHNREHLAQSHFRNVRVCVFVCAVGKIIPTTCRASHFNEIGKLNKPRPLYSLFISILVYRLCCLFKYIYVLYRWMEWLDVWSYAHSNACYTIWCIYAPHTIGIEIYMIWALPSATPHSVRKCFALKYMSEIDYGHHGKGKKYVQKKPLEAHSHISFIRWYGESMNIHHTFTLLVIKYEGALWRECRRRRRWRRWRRPDIENHDPALNW